MRAPSPPPVPPAAGDGEGDGANGAAAGGDAAKAKRPPMAFYDPKMPGMPEQLPFPDEGIIRRGALGALAMGQGISFVPLSEPGAAADGATLAADAADGAPHEQLSEEALAERARRLEEARRAQEAAEADAFDLDLN